MKELINTGMYVSVGLLAIGLAVFFFDRRIAYWILAAAFLLLTLTSAAKGELSAVAALILFVVTAKKIIG